MQRTVLKKWQRSWGTALALVALLAWCMPTIAMACAISSMPPDAMLQCNKMASGVSLEAHNAGQMPCCEKVPIPPSSSINTYSAVISTDGHANLLSVEFPVSHAPLWALLIAAPDFNCDAAVKSTFPLENFSSPPSAEAATPLRGRAPPSLI